MLYFYLSLNVNVKVIPKVFRGTSRFFKRGPIHSTLDYWMQIRNHALVLVLRIRTRIRIRIHQIHMFLGLLDPDPDP